MRGLADAIEGELDNIVPIMQSPSFQTYRRFCDFFLLNEDQADKFRDLEAELKIPFTKLRLRSYQAWDVFVMLISNMRGLNGGMLASQYSSDPTIYKQTCLAVCFIRALVAYTKAECQLEWKLCCQDKNRRRRHHPESNPFSQKCPSDNPLGIQCFCTGSTTREISHYLSRGIQQIFVRQENIDEWVKLIDNCSPDPRYYEPLLIHHFSREHLRPGPEFKGKMEINPKFRRTTHRGEQNVFDAEWSVSPPSSSNPKRQPERYIVLVGQEPNYLKRYRTFMSNRLDDFGYNTEDQKLKGQVPIDPSDRYPYSYGAFVGLHIIDQYYLVSPTSPIFELIEEHRYIMHKAVDTWVVSEKPMNNGFNGLIPLLRCIYRSKWNKPLELHHYKLPEKLRVSELLYQRAIDPRLAAESKDVQLAIDHFTNKLYRYLVCRRTLNSEWFDRPISKSLGPTTYSSSTPRVGSLILDVQGIFDKARADIRSICGGSVNVNQVVRCLKTYKQLRLCQIVSTLPGAAGYLIDGDIDVSNESVEASLLKTGRRSSLELFPLPADRLDELLANSGKLTYILEAIEMMLRMSAIGEKQRMVISCIHLFEAVLVLTGIRRHFDTSALKAVYLPSRPSAYERNYFSHNWSSEDRKSIRVVIVLVDCEEVGFGLDRANWQILTGPTRTKDQEVRVFSLTNSTRQRRPLHHYLLCTEDNPADRLILSRQANSTVISDPFDMNSPLLLSETGAEAGPGSRAGARNLLKR